MIAVFPLFPPMHLSLRALLLSMRARTHNVNACTVRSEKGHKRVHRFSIYLVTAENQAELAFEGESSGKTKHFQVFSLGDKASFCRTDVLEAREAFFYLAFFLGE